jgi:hypothetical protein
MNVLYKIKNTALMVSLLLSAMTQAQEKLIYHDIRTDHNGNIVPWYSEDLGASYDHIIELVWNFWDTMRTDVNSLPYYMNHQVWKPGYNDARGLGGDQLQMALSSWQLLYAYSGNERVKQNMKFIADYYLTHSLSPANCKWPNLPFPYNTLIYSGVYDGDMVIGEGYLQPDKAGSLGLELIHLYKISSGDFYLQSTSGRYLGAAIKIAHTLIAHLQPGDEGRSPLPFKVNAFTGETGQLKSNNVDGTIIGEAAYTTNWSATMELFLALQQLDPGNAAGYKNAFNLLLDWMKKYPLRNTRWGPFFEDVQGWSDTQINAATFARFMMEHTEYFPDWQRQVQDIFAWTCCIAPLPGIPQENRTPFASSPGLLIWLIRMARTVFHRMRTGSQMVTAIMCAIICVPWLPARNLLLHRPIIFFQALLSYSRQIIEGK